MTVPTPLALTTITDHSSAIAAPFRNNYASIQTAVNSLIGSVGPTFNVKHSDYGAKGDGVADDSPAIQAAYNACFAAGGGTVQFPAGIFKLNTAPIQLTRNNGATPIPVIL